MKDIFKFISIIFLVSIIFVQGFGIYSIAIPINGNLNLKEIEENYGPIITRASKTYKIPRDVIYYVIAYESNFNPNAVSPKGAVGLMQLMPETAKLYGVTDRKDPLQNIMAGTCHLRILLDRYNNDLNLALAAYNSGERNVDKYGGVPPFRETVDYVQKITVSLKMNAM